MIGRELLEAVMPGQDVSDEQAAQAEKIILAFAIEDIDKMHERMSALVGLRLIDALRDPDASASHINSAMKWLDSHDPNKEIGDAVDPVAAAIANARAAMEEGGKLPDIDEYTEEEL